MWELSLPWWEFVLRATIIYVMLLVLLRVGGKKQIGEMSPIDLVLLLILSETVQNSMNAGDQSITGGAILATTLVLLSNLTDRLIFRSKKVERIIEGVPKLLIHNGRILQKNMDEEKVTHGDLMESLRKSGVIDSSKVHYAFLETDGKISVIKYEQN